MSNDNEYRDVLETKRVEIIRGINCERPLLLDYLRSNQDFDQTDCELIRAETTNDARAGKLIDFLLKKGPQAYQHFLDVVQMDNPTLYETLTGEKAYSKPNPLMKFSELKPGEFSQLQTLVEYQQKMLQDLSDNTRRYRDVLKANEALDKKLEKALKDLEFEKEKRKHYENRLTQEMEIDDSLSKNELLLYHEYDEMEKGIADRDVYIIVLQMKLLAEKEEVEKLKTKVEELEHKNERMAHDLRRVSQNYNHERCQSLKLSECIRIQGDEIQKIDELRKQLREAKYKNIIVAEERDSKLQELMELKKWAEALKTRFDVVEKEKQSSLEKTEVVSNNCVYLQETVRTLNQKLSSAHLELEELRKCNEILTKDCELFKTQRNNALDARKEAVISRDEVISEKETIQAQYSDLLAKREQMNEERADLLKSYDTLHARYKTTSEDLIRVKTALHEKEMEVDDLTRKLKEANDKNHRNSVLLENLPCLSDDDDSSSGALENTAQQLTETADADEETCLKRPWRERRMKSLLNSIKNRIAGDRSEESPTREPMSLMAGNVTLDVLQHLLPNLNTRPYSTSTPETAHAPKISRTLHRQMCLRQKKAECSKIRSKTAPSSFGIFPDMFPFDCDYDDDDDDPSPGVKSTRSTPNLMYPDDVNVVPSFFRGRARNMTKKPYRRTKSTQ